MSIVSPISPEVGECVAHKTNSADSQELIKRLRQKRIRFLVDGHGAGRSSGVRGNSLPSRLVRRVFSIPPIEIRG